MKNTMKTIMKSLLESALPSLCLLLGLSISPARSAPVVKIADDFESGNPGYFRNGSAAQLFTTDDSAGIGSGDALQHNPNGSTFRKIIRTYSAFTLSSEGDYLELNFDLRFPSGSPTSNSQGFRFGLYNSNGTAPTADGQNLTTNDFGYYSALGTGGTAGKFIFETEANGFLGGGTQNQLVGGGTTALNDALAHQITFRLERVATGLSVDLSFDGGSILAVVDTSPTTYTFDQIGIGLGSVSSTDDNYRIDNVQLTAVPEPSSLMLVGIALAGGLTVFRGRRFLTKRRN